MHEDKTLGDACGPGDSLQPSVSAAPPIAELPEPSHYWQTEVPGRHAPLMSPLYTADQMRAQFAAGRLAGLDAAANADGLAECMHLFRSDMIEAGVITEKVPPMFMTEAILSALAKDRRDAERYRWLQNSENSPIVNEGIATDAMIDSALAREAGARQEKSNG